MNREELYICLKCHKPYTPKDWLYRCEGKCDRFICHQCSSEICQERTKLCKERTCQYCTLNFDEFCSKCQKHIKLVYHEEIQRTADFLKRGYGFLENNWMVSKNFQEYLDLKGNWVDQCRCDPRCLCISNIYRETKKKRNIDFALYETADETGDFVMTVCDDCFKIENPNENSNENLKYVPLPNEIPMF